MAAAASEPTSEPTDESNESETEDEVKRKFREALERKQSQNDKRSGGGSRDSSKVHGAHGPAQSKRTFRRKSG
jgi:hypothetical protein